MKRTSLNQRMDPLKSALLNDLHKQNYSEFLWGAIQQRTVPATRSLSSLTDAVEIGVRRKTYVLGTLR